VYDAPCGGRGRGRELQGLRAAFSRAGVGVFEGSVVPIS
jgi:hypothetical protein